MGHTSFKLVRISFSEVFIKVMLYTRNSYLSLMCFFKRDKKLIPFIFAIDWCYFSLNVWSFSSVFQTMWHKMNYQLIHQIYRYIRINELVDKSITRQSLSPKSIYSQRKFPATFYYVQRLCALHESVLEWSSKFFKLNHVIIDLFTSLRWT